MLTRSGRAAQALQDAAAADEAALIVRMLDGDYFIGHYFISASAIISSS